MWYLPELLKDFDNCLTTRRLGTGAISTITDEHLFITMREEKLRQFKASIKMKPVNCGLDVRDCSSLL